MSLSPTDPREQSLAFIQENLATAACYADAAHSLASADDLRGLEYAITKLISHVKVAASTTRDLVDSVNEVAKAPTPETLYNIQDKAPTATAGAPQ
ncbi:hypothetical protein [Beijerinckia sp. L45]|uniref:hypothetical protein n=1 Tax=Beijerinckia sp. L45 TaxID=1641855 RepID=UPI00131B66AC|nr:hypothetical protein [Beijerinckia sp. L45]